jgi:hypothetical protein
MMKLVEALRTRRKCIKLVRQRNQAGGVKWEQLKKIMMKKGKNYYIIPNNVVCHEELCTIDDQPREVTEKKDDDNADEDTSKIHLIMSRAVVVGPHMGVSVQTHHIRRNNS